MTNWFKNLSPDNWIAIAAIAVPVIVAAIVGLFKLFGKKKDSPSKQNAVRQKGNNNTTTIADENKGNIVGGDHIENITGIDGTEALKQLVDVSKEAGQSKNEIQHLKEKNKHLLCILMEKQNVQPQVFGKMLNQAGFLPGPLMY